MMKYKVILVVLWWYRVSIRQYWLVLGGHNKLVLLRICYRVIIDRAFMPVYIEKRDIWSDRFTDNKVLLLSLYNV